ncbi:MAG: CHRD domain-containing protein [Pseudohongiellaceae bacterium]
MNPGNSLGFFRPAHILRVARYLTIASSLFLAASTQAQEEVYRARLSPMPTTPQTVDEILGEGEVLLSLSGTTLSVSGNFQGLSSGATAAHIHNGPPAQPGPVIHTLTVTQANSGELTGELTLTDDQVMALKANSFYIQIHSENNPPGELRGWVFLLSHFQ